MRKIYLVRHAEPDTGTREKVCLGQRDVPLKQESVPYVEKLSLYFLRPGIQEGIREMFSSPLHRCRATAEILRKNIGKKYSKDKEGEPLFPELTLVEDFQEVDTGIWDGIPFKEIKKRFPSEYEERGKQLGTYRIPEGETLEEAGLRFRDALRKVLADTVGDLVIVTHAGVIRSFLCMITGKDVNQLTDWSVPYGSITELHFQDEEHASSWTVKEVGLIPVETMDMDTVEALWTMCGTSDEQQLHMIATAAFAMGQIEELPDFTETDRAILYYSSLLHDLLRSEGRGHEKAGAEWLWKKGYHELAEPVSLHNDPGVYKEHAPVSAAEVLYYADKRVKDAEIVSVEDRFETSRKRITDEIGIRKHKERMLTAFAIGKKLREHTAYRGSFLASICQMMLEEETGREQEDS